MIHVFFQVLSSLRSELRLALRSAAAFLVGGGLTLLLVGCDLLGNDESFDVPRERLVVMTTVYEETLPGGRPVHRLVVADVQNPSTYKVLSQAGKYAEQPCFGPEKRRLLFEDHKGTPTDSDGQITLLNLESGAVRPLVDSVEGGRQPLQGELGRCVWAADGSGFYYTAYLLGGFAYQAYYDLEKGKKVPPFPQTSDEVFVAARMGRDTLVVNSHKAECAEESCQHSTTYLMNPEGQYLSRIDNPHFFTQDQGYWYSIGDWTGEQEMFALLSNDTTSTGWKVAVTNVDGSYWEATSGEYEDGQPSWGPNGEFVLFDRLRPQDYEFTDYRLMALNPETGNVREFVNPEVVDGAVALRQPDY